jgi:transposase-like protein
MECVSCGSAATTERRDRTAQGYRRFRCRDCGREFNERSGGLLNRTQYPSDVIALVVLWRLRYRGHSHIRLKTRVSAGVSGRSPRVCTKPF